MKKPNALPIIAIVAFLVPVAGPTHAQGTYNQAVLGYAEVSSDATVSTTYSYNATGQGTG